MAKVKSGVKIYNSPPSLPDDDFWLEYGKKMIESSLKNIQDGAKALISGLSLLKGIYLGILGLGKYIPEAMPLGKKVLFILPFIFWLGALYLSLQVILPQKQTIYIFSPDDIKTKSDRVLKKKQILLTRAFWLLGFGILAAFIMVVLRLVF